MATELDRQMWAQRRQRQQHYSDTVLKARIDAKAATERDKAQAQTAQRERIRLRNEGVGQARTMTGIPGLTSNQISRVGAGGEMFNRSDGGPALPGQAGFRFNDQQISTLQGLAPQFVQNDAAAGRRAAIGETMRQGQIGDTMIERGAMENRNLRLAGDATQRDSLTRQTDVTRGRDNEATRIGNDFANATADRSQRGSQFDTSQQNTMRMASMQQRAESDLAYQQREHERQMFDKQLEAAGALTPQAKIAAAQSMLNSPDEDVRSLANLYLLDALGGMEGGAAPKQEPQGSKGLLKGLVNTASWGTPVARMILGQPFK